MPNQERKNNKVPFSLHFILTEACYHSLASGYICYREPSLLHSGILPSSSTYYGFYRFSRYFSQHAPHSQQIGIVSHPFPLPSPAILIAYTPERIETQHWDNVYHIGLHYFKTHST